jgi:methylthioribose-1-phosphate isomerase
MKINGQHQRTIWHIYKTATPASGAKLSVEYINQNVLPHKLQTCIAKTTNDIILAIRNMLVRGAPLIGAAGAYGMALACAENPSDAWLKQRAQALIDARPTAVNLSWAVNRLLHTLLPLPPEQRLAHAVQLCSELCDEDVAINQAIGQHGLTLIQAIAAQRPFKTIQILTHCNAGWLATVDWGTALAPIYAAYDAGIDCHVWVDETRPRNQGAALTAWELAQHGVPHTVICDNAGGHLMQHGQVDMVIVGADRVSRQGDVCNKIGTYLKALAAKDNHIPFYAAVPSPTIDWNIAQALHEIPIEMRSPDEVKWISGINRQGEAQEVCILPESSPALNPAFDVTPASLVTGIITERGVFAPHELAPAFAEQA